MYKIDLFQHRYVKIDVFGRWDLEILSVYAGTKFTSTEFQDEYQTCCVRLTLAALEHQQTNGRVEVTQRMLHTIEQSLMVHAIVLEAYIIF